MKSSPKFIKIIVSGILLILVTLLPLAITRLAGASSPAALKSATLTQPSEMAFDPGAAREPIMFFATYTVNDLGDTGAGSGTTGDLRYCMTQANAAGGADTINFSVTGTITLTSALPNISDSLTINGPGVDLLTVSGNNTVRLFTTSSVASATFSNLTIADGTAPSGSSFGGGIYHRGSGTVSITNCVVRNCSAGFGGGIYNEFTGTINITNSTVRNNSATISSGGGLFNNVGGTINATGSTFHNNSVGSGHSGGGISNNSNGASRLNITNCTFSNNSAGLGGGLWSSAGIAIVTNCTFTSNTANGGGGLGKNPGVGTLQIQNSIIAQNSAPSSPDLANDVTSLGYNLIGTNSGATGFTAGLPNASNDYVGTNVAPVSPQLAPLGNYGGQTQTHALLSNSLAIDHGSAAAGVTTDQTGTVRPVDIAAIAPAAGGNNSDIGAFELGAFVLLGGNTTYTPALAPVGAVRMNVSTSTNFKGTFVANPITGVVRITNAHPAGIYPVTVKAFDTIGTITTSTFTLVVQTSAITCGAPSFSSAANVGNGSNACAVAVGDFNNDGKQDLATAYNISDWVAIRFGNGAGGFTGSTNVPVGPASHPGHGIQPDQVVIGDFNNDGNQDFATANYHTGTVSIRLGDGTGGFTGETPTSEITTGTNAHALAVDDFNGDGKQDLAIANSSPGTVSILLGDGLGAFTILSNLSIFSPRSVAVGDFNSDGKQDLAIASFDQILIRMGDGLGGFSGSGSYTVGNRPSSVAIGDFNNDGKQDFATANPGFSLGNNTASVRLGDGLGGFSGTTTVTVGTGAYSIAIGDFNNDGKQDFATANYNQASVSVILGDGLGSFPAAVNVGVGSRPTSVAIGDFNGDNTLDFAAANVSSNNTSVRLGSCSANSAPTITAQSGVSRQQGSLASNSQIATVGDTESSANAVTVTITSANPSNGVTISNIVNSGGNVTANISANCTATNASFTLQASDGSLTSTATLSVTVNANAAPALGNYPTANVSAGGSTTVTPSAAPSDNGTITGISASVSPASFTGAFSVNTSTGVVTVNNAAPAGAYIVTVTATDDCGAIAGKTFTLNVSPPTLGNYGNATVNLSGNTTITPSAAPINAVSISASTSTKFKGILTANLSTGAVRVVNAHPAGTYTVTVKAFGAGGMSSRTFTLTVQGGTLCTATQGFVNAPDVPVNSHPHALALGDFNEDGKQDFAVGYASSDPVALRFGDGAGGFTGTATVSTGPFIHSIAVGDFNEDGHQDLASGGNDGSLGVYIRLGDGAGNFSGSTTVPAGIHPVSIAIGDFNNDGHQDFATANNIDDAVAIRLGDGTGNFSGTTSVAVGDQPVSVAIGDFNNDGNQDFATANASSNFVSIRLGNGLGGFTNAADVPVSILAQCVVTGDFNGDNIQDIAASGSSMVANLVSIRLGTGSGSFTGTTDVAVSSGPQRMVTGDFNNDGHQDFATTNVGFGTISLRFGNGAGNFTDFTATSEISVGVNPRPFAVGDFNGDGRQDFVVVHFNDSNFAAVRLNSCSTPPTISAFSVTRMAGSSLSNSTIANVNDAEDPENTLTVTVNNASSATVNGVTVSNITVDAAGVVKGDVVAACGATNASFTLTVTDSAGLTNTAALAVTVNANTAPALGNYPTANVNAGGSTTVTPAAAPSDNGAITGITASAPGFTGSFNVDTTSGVITVSNARPGGSYTVTVTATDSCGTTTSKNFMLNVNCPVITVAPPTLANATLGLPYNHSISASGGTAPYSFTFTGTLPTGLTLNSDGTWSGAPSAANTFNFTVTATDANGCTGNRPYSVTIFPSATLGAYPNAMVNLSGNTTVMPATAPANATGITATSSTDFKGELEVTPAGIVRITNAHPAGSHTVTVMAFNSAGSATTASFTLTVTSVACNAFNFVDVTSFAAGATPNSVAVGDFNRDGKQDFVIANQGSSNNVSVLLGDGAGGFSAATNFPSGGGPVSIAVGDFNGDGKEDLSTANISGLVSIFLGDGAGAFPARTDISVGGSPFQVAIADLNNDGRQDIVVARNTADAVAVLLGNGAGGFAAPLTTGVGARPNALAIGDFNNDGKPDVVTTNDVSDDISILLGNGQGGFSSVTNTGIGARPSQVAIGDFNNDGKQDIVFAKYDLQRVTVWQGDGLGGFTSLGDFFSGGALTRSVAIGDFNGDGRQDIVIGNNESDDVSFLLNNGAGGFAPAVHFPVGDFPALVAVADFNGDGLQDIVTANQNSNDASVLLRLCNTRPAISAVNITRPADNATANLAIANVNDAEDAENLLTVTVNNASSATVNGVTVSNITVDATGGVKADVVAACAASSASFTLKVTDTGGLMNPPTPPITLTVTITPDATPPTITCPGNITRSADAGQCTAVVTYTPPTLTDNCSGGTVVCNPSSGTVFQKGTTTVTCTATDAAGNSSTPCTFTVTVNDTQSPTLTCPTPVTRAADANLCTAVVIYALPQASDNCANVGTVSCSPASGTVFPKGVTTVNCNVTDASGNPASCAFTVTVNDQQAPTLTCPANLIVSTDAGICTAVVNFTTPTVSDNCPNPTVVCLPPSGSTFQKGTTTVTCTASDAATPPNTGSCTFTVTVNDTEKPVIPCPANMSAPTTADQCQAVVNYALPVATDNCANVGTVSCSPASGTVFPKGVTTVNCNVTDANGNTNNCSFTVTVNDMQTPTIACPSPIVRTTDANLCTAVVIYALPQASDNCANVGTVSCSPASGTVFPKGVTTVICSVMDASNNPGNCSFTVTVNDQQPPTVTCPANVSIVSNTCVTNAYTSPAGNDNCPNVTVVCVPPPGTCFEPGTVTTITCTATDAAANKANCTFTVTIIPCTISCPANVFQVNDANQCGAVVNYPAPTTTGNCGTIICTPPAGSVFAKGTTTVNCSTTAGPGCAFTVTVADNQAPVLSGCTNVTANTASNACSAVVNYSVPTALDNCDGARPVMCTPPSGTAFPKGVTTVTCTVSDLNTPTANTGICNFTVTVTDNVLPVLTGCTNVTATTALNACNAVVSYKLPTADDNCDGGRMVTCTPPPGSTFLKGVTSVTCTASDTSNNTASCTFTVTITDSQSPTLSCPANILKTTDANQCSAVVTFSASANDNCTGATTSCNPPAGSSFPKGTTTVTCTASDASGNAATPCSFSITINDAQLPNISCPAGITKATDANQCSAVVTYAAPVVSDNCPGVGTPICTPPSGTAFAKGMTTVNCTVKDASLNQSACAFTVTINDTQLPLITCPANQRRALANPTDATVLVSYPTPVFTDNCAGASVACLPPSGSAFPVGLTTVNCTASDAANNQRSCGFTVTVFDVCLQDDAISGTVLLLNSFTGDYLFCCGGTSYSGKGTVQKLGSTYTLTHNTPERRVTARLEGAQNRGTASLQSPVGTMRCTLNDRDIRNNSCLCQ
jgi:hypothetical protein